MTGTSYAMAWREDTGPRVVGKVELADDAVVLEATVPPGSEQRVPFGQIVDTALLGGVLRVDHEVGVLLIQTLDAGGALRELAERIETAVASAHARS